MELIALDILNTKLLVQVHVSVTVISILDRMSNYNTRTDISPKRTSLVLFTIMSKQFQVTPLAPGYPNKSIPRRHRIIRMIKQTYCHDDKSVQQAEMSLNPPGPLS